MYIAAAIHSKQNRVINVKNGLIYSFKSIIYKARPSQIIAAGFLLIILAGAALLAMPVSSASAEPTNFTDALFTAASAVCITGLTVYDTAAHWSIFGQIVILILIQTGGLGFMTIAAMLSFMTRRKITLRERLIMVETLNGTQIRGIVGVTKNVLKVTLAAEAAGSAVLALRLIPIFGARGIYMAVFTAVSAFCNAGFDVLGTAEKQFVNLMPFASDTIINVTVMLLIISGGLGFAAISNLYHARKLSDLSVQTKLTVIITAGLILCGAAVFFVCECGNPLTMGNMETKDKILASFFQSVTTRTAGFNTISQKGLKQISKAASVLLMLVGGSSGSTAGGIKTVTAGVVALSVVSTLKGKRDVTVFGKRISEDAVRRAYAVTVLAAAIIGVSAVLISALENKPLMYCLYETASAYCTVGLTADVTPTLGGASKYLLAVLMFAGRVGAVALIPPPSANEKIRCPEAKIIIG